MNIIFDENGVADVYDDTYDIVIHCESEEDQKDAKLALKNAVEHHALSHFPASHSL